MRWRKPSKGESLTLPVMCAREFALFLKIAGVDEPEDLDRQFEFEFDKLPDPPDDDICLRHLKEMVNLRVDECLEFPEHVLLEIYSMLRTRIIMTRFMRKYIPNAKEIPEFEAVPDFVNAHTSEEWAKRTKKIHWETV